MKNRYLLTALIFLALLSLFLGLSGFAGRGLKIMVISRIPRVMSLIMAGMSMSISGLIMQRITRNRFVSPTTAATVDAAKGGVLAVLILFPKASSLLKMSLVFAFALAGTFLFMAILKRVKFKHAIFIPLLGIMLGSIFDALTTFVAYRYDLIQNISSWLLGNFSLIMQGRYELLYLSVPLLILAYLFAHQFTVAGLGEEVAVNLGLNYRLVVNIGVTLVALLSALVIITAGRIPFLGLIVPNLVTIYYGDNLKASIGATALLGAAFLLAADLLGRVVIPPYEIPIGLTVGAAGSIMFLYLIFRGQAA
ncbi:MAG TPA: iron chelate uptake ABC transporter family permease subunit [Firmicutes bacterium]|nr:iron chelate uptake ABC transporter family permease subunit [Bacillota bacterium]